MKKDKKNLTAAPDPAAVSQFKGFNMEDLRYRRAMLALRKEFCKANLLQSVHDLKPKKSSSGSSSPFGSKFAMAGRVVSKLFSNMNTLDYVLMGISLFGTARKGLKLIRRK